MKKATKYTIRETCHGYYVRVERSGDSLPLWVASIHRGRVEWVIDPAQARAYSPRTARLIVARLLGGEIK